MEATEKTSSETPDAPPAPETAKTKDPTGYDSKARQRIPVTLLLDDGRYYLTLVCEPMRDETLTAYARVCEAANAAESVEDEGGDASQISALARAVAWLFSALTSDVEGVGEEGEEKPADWREIFGPQERQTIIDRAVFGVETVEPPPAKKDKRPSWGSHLRAVVTRLRVPFNGKLIEVSHTLRKADAAQLGEFLTLYTSAFGRGRAGDANLEKFAAGYDALHVAHEHYKGPVPMHHKAVAFITHMTRQGRP